MWSADDTRLAMVVYLSGSFHLLVLDSSTGVTWKPSCLVMKCWLPFF